MNPSRRLGQFCLAILAASLVACGSTPTKEGTGEFVDDAIITTKVKAAIVKEPTLKLTDISVVTFKGVVELSGFVDAPEGIDRAGQLARTVVGVKLVRNDLHTK
jgi:osmotically-inducible protein OsmY